ncbi:MAG: glutamine synthetase beta-grasp domain-containing protein [Halobacteriota archaeon]
MAQEELEDALTNGVGFDGSTIEGHEAIEESDTIAQPASSTFAVLPWRPKERGVARIKCDIQELSGRPFEGDPRYVLKRNLERAEKKGFTFKVDLSSSTSTLQIASVRSS